MIIRVWIEIIMVLVDFVIFLFNVIYYGVNMKIYNIKIKKKFEEDFKKYNVREDLSKLLFLLKIMLM